MKSTKLFAIMFLIFAGLFSLTAEIPENLSFSLTTDFAYYPKSDFISGNTHFAPITGPFDGVEARTVAEVDYMLQTPLGSHWLLADANFVFAGKVELTPVSIRPIIDCTFTPLPFLVFNAGVSVGSGWTLLGLQGMASYDYYKREYDDMSFGSSWYYKYWVNGTFQFDTGAIWAGDWTHFQILYTYELYYKAISNMKNQQLWMWQVAENQVNGLESLQTLILAYQLPFAVHRVGVMTEWEGYLKADVFENSSYKGDFKTIYVSPLAQVSLGKNDDLSCVLGFAMRRSYEENHTENTEEPFLTYAGNEWYFNRIAFSWTHNF